MKKNNYLGNKNAKKEITKSSSIHIRIEESQKKILKDFAKKRGFPLSAWLLYLAEEEIQKKS